MAARRLRWFAFALCALLPQWLIAQTVYRCGPDGARTYSQLPCPDGHGRAIDVADPRDTDQWSEAADVAQRDADAGRRLEQERQRNEATRKKAIGIHAGGSLPREPMGEQAARRPKTVRAVKAPCPSGCGPRGPALRKQPRKSSTANKAESRP